MSGSKDRLSGELSAEARLLLEDSRAAQARAALEKADLLFEEGRHAEAILLHARALAAFGLLMRELPLFAFWIGVTEERIRQDVDALEAGHRAGDPAARRRRP